jgi:signal transduction histidine kinase
MSFIFAGLVSIVVMIISLVIDIVPTPYSAFAYLVVALVSYLGATQLENALGRLRLINEELDQRVDERTAELRAANERLRELDRLKSRFVSTVSHELRTPLSAIQGFAEMLTAGIYGQLAARQERALSRILANTAQLLHLVNDLLDQARIEAGQIEIKEEVFDPEELIANTVEDLQVLTEENVDLQMDVKLPDAILGDPNRIRQILRNLIGNALKFTEEGSVTVRTFTKPDDDLWYLDVIDTGPGIPKEAQEYIFSPFRQVDGSETRTHRGVGLGLSITRQLVLLMDGEIWVESEIGVGSTFSVKLPLKTAE